MQLKRHGAKDEDREEVLIILKAKELSNNDNGDRGDERPDKGRTNALFVKKTGKFEDRNGKKQANEKHKPDTT